MKLKTSALAGAALFTTVTLATPASAQRIDNIVAFGDSFADTGNAIAILLANPAVPAGTKAQLQTIYPTGRFSGGTNYIDTLSTLLDATVENYAVGGAQTGTGNGTVPDLGLTTQTGIFLSGTVPPGTPFLPSDGTFEKGDLLALSIGGNDAIAFQEDNPAATEAETQAAAAIAVTNATANLDALVAAGAPTISFLAVDAGSAPRIAGNPTGAAIQSNFSNSFNAGIQTTLAKYASNGVMVHYLDGPSVLTQVAADPQAYGITNGLVCPAFPDPTCVVDASGYLFYGDLLHLTSDGYAILGQYVAAQLQAPLTLAGPSDVALDTARQFGRTLNSRVDLGSPRDGEVAEGMKFFITGDTFSRDVARSDSTDAFDVDGVGGTVGAEFGFANGVAGVAANYTRGRADFVGDPFKDRTRSIQLGGYAGYAVGPAFVQGHVGYGWDKHKLTREGVVENMRARPKGRHWTAGAKAGYLMPMADFRVGPVVAFDYAKAKVNSYTESGDAALTLNVSKVDLKAVTGSLGLEARGDFEGAGISVRPFISAMAEKEFSGDGRTVRFAQTSAPTIVNSWDLGERDKGIYARLGGGASAAIMANTSLDVHVSSTFGKDDGDELGAQLGLRIGF